MRNSHIESIIIFLSIPASSSPDSASKSYWFVLLTAQKKMWELYSSTTRPTSGGSCMPWIVERASIDPTLIWIQSSLQKGRWCIITSCGHLPSPCSWLFKGGLQDSKLSRTSVKVNAFYMSWLFLWSNCPSHDSAFWSPRVVAKLGRKIVIAKLFSSFLLLERNSLCERNPPFVNHHPPLKPLLLPMNSISLVFRVR